MKSAKQDLNPIPIKFGKEKIIQSLNQFNNQSSLTPLITLINDELNWQPAETFETGIRKTVEWYLGN